MRNRVKRSGGKIADVEHSSRLVPGAHPLKSATYLARQIALELKVSDPCKQLNDHLIEPTQYGYPKPVLSVSHPGGEKMCATIRKTVYCS